MNSKKGAAMLWSVVPGTTPAEVTPRDGAPSPTLPARSIRAVSGWPAGTGGASRAPLKLA